MRVQVAVAVFLFQFISVEARAQYDPGEASRPPAAEVKPPIEKHWYGWQTLAVDAVAAAGFVLAAEHAQEHGVFGSLTVFLLVPPIVHVTHDRLGAAGGSLALRFAGLMVLLSVATPCGSEDCSAFDFYAPMAAASVIPSVLDAAFLGNEPVSSQSARLTPSLWVDSTGARLAVRTRF